jgi:hypothetical protein
VRKSLLMAMTFDTTSRFVSITIFLVRTSQHHHHVCMLSTHNSRQ